MAKIRIGGAPWSSTEPRDGHGHGTHVSLRSNSVAENWGIATDAACCVFQVLNDQQLEMSDLNPILLTLSAPLETIFWLSAYALGCLISLSVVRTFWRHESWRERI
jgi:hypothetical protein